MGPDSFSRPLWHPSSGRVAVTLALVITATSRDASASQITYEAPLNAESEPWPLAADGSPTHRWVIPVVPREWAVREPVRDGGIAHAQRLLVPGEVPTAGAHWPVFGSAVASEFHGLARVETESHLPGRTEVRILPLRTDARVALTIFRDRIWVDVFPEPGTWVFLEPGIAPPAALDSLRFETALASSRQGRPDRTLFELSQMALGHGASQFETAAILLWGRELRLRGRPLEAARILEATLPPKNTRGHVAPPQVLHDLARTLEEAGEIDRATRYWRRLNDTYPTESWFLGVPEDCARMLRRAGQPGKARAAVDRGLRGAHDHETRARLLALDAELLMDLARPEHALSRWEEAFATGFTAPLHWTLSRADALFMAEHWRDARQTYGHYLGQARPGHVPNDGSARDWSRYQIANCWLREGHWAKARAAYGEFESNAPEALWLERARWRSEFAAWSETQLPGEAGVSP